MDKIHWHPGVQGATEWELKANKKDLTFEYDHPLSKEPLKMDALIIKKDPNVIIQNVIGKLFKAHNVVEYKELYRKLRKEKKYMGEAIQELFQEDIDKKIAELSG